MLGAILLCAFATAAGLSKLAWAQSPALSWLGWESYVVLAGSALLTEGLARWRRVHRWAAASAVGTVGIVAGGAGWLLLVVGRVPVCPHRRRQGRSGDSHGSLPAAGILLGAGVAAKAIALRGMPILLVVFLLRDKRWATARTIKPVIVGIIMLVLLGIDSYLRAWVMSANPLFPAYLRYVLPSTIMIVAIMGVVLSPTTSLGGATRAHPWHTRWLTVTACAAVTLNLLFFRAATNFGELAWRVMLSETDHTAYMAPPMPIQSAIELVNRLSRQRSPMAVFSSPLAAGRSANAYYPN